MDVDRTLHHHGPDVLDFTPPPQRSAVDRTLHHRGPVYKAPDAPLPDAPSPDELRPANAYDPWNKADEIRSGVVFDTFASPPIAPAAKVYDETALRSELQDAQAIRGDALDEVERYCAARARATVQLDGLVAEVERARAERQAQDLGEVDRLREAALAGGGIALPVFGAASMSDAERGVPVLQALVARLDGEVAEHEKVLGAADAVMARVVAEMMEAEAEVLAEELWAAKCRVAALHARLDGFTRSAPPHLQRAPGPNRRVDLGGGNFIMEPDYSAMTPPRFAGSPAIAKALHRTPGLDASGFPTGDSNFLNESDAWGRYAAALRSDSEARPIPVIEPYEALK